MGLDVTLYKCADLAVAKRAEEEYEKRTNDLWSDPKPYEQYTEAEKEEIRFKDAEIAAELGIVDYRHVGNREAEVPESAIDPDHMFKLNYFRSSYNSAGLNAVMRNIGLPGLYEIFQTDWDAEPVAPDWDDALRRLDKTISEYEAHLASDVGKYKVIEVHQVGNFGAASEKEALDIFARELSRGHALGFSAFMNRDGNFWMDGLPVHALIPSTARPGEYYAVVKREESDKPDWHLTALQIVRESVIWVIAQPDRAEYYLHFSG